MILLEAPQFPEGLSMYIWTTKITGNVDTINGLNHYIGMQKISEASFPELKILPWGMVFFLVFGLATSLSNKKSILYIYTGLFVAFALASMTDFYMWEYRYGHELDPKAPIKLDDMTFQPPLLGYKQIANFLAGSFPAAGGAFFIISVALAVVATAIELKIFQLFKRGKSTKAMSIVSVFILFFSISCTPGTITPQPINFGTDECNHCKMTISDKKYGSEIITAKGKAYKFDDIGCMISFEKEYAQKHKEEKLHRFVINFNSPATFSSLESAFILKGGSLRTPMASELTGFSTIEGAQNAQKEYGGEIIKGTELK